MVTKAELFPSKYLSAADLNGKPLVAQIQEVTDEMLKDFRTGNDSRKAVVHFAGVQKSLPLNVTNFNSIATICSSDDTDDWPGHGVEIYPALVQMKGEEVEAIRIRKPPAPNLPLQKKAKPPSAPIADEMNDSIPF